MKAIKFINVSNYEAGAAKEYVAYLKNANVMIDIRLKPGTNADNTITFYYPNDHTNNSIKRINDAIIEIFDDYDEEMFEHIFNKIESIKEDETLIWDNAICNFVE